VKNARTPLHVMLRRRQPPASRSCWSLAAALPAQQRSRPYVEARVYATSQAPLQLLADRGLRAFEPLEQPDENYPTIMIDPDKTFQAIDGFGGAFTGCHRRRVRAAARRRRRSS